MSGQITDTATRQEMLSTESEVVSAEAPDDYVSIQVDGGTIRQVLSAFAIQTGRNVVIGPEVIGEEVTIHLNNVRWDEALEVILKPYGFGYRRVGDTIVISRLEKLASLEAVESLETKVFNLKYLDAGDVQDIIRGQLSLRGTSSVVAARGQTGWAFASMADKSSDTAGALSKLARQIDPKAMDQVKSKTLIVTDVPSSLGRVAAVLAEVDKMQQQVLVEARLMEVNAALEKSVGLDFQKITLTASGAGQSIGGGPANPFGFGENDFSAMSAIMDASAIINLLQQDEDTKVLSAPRILTLNNQEATIVVGQKFPIIKSEINEGNTGSPTKTTTLERYEPSGIQLNVVPQICDDGLINMIVHPTVSSFVGFETVIDQGETVVRYPIVNVRETETQIILKTGETVVIGGLLEERTKVGVQKLPILGSIPLIGRLFRNETAENQTIDLLIFLTATIVDENNYETIIAKEGASTMEGAGSVVTHQEAVEIEPALQPADEEIEPDMSM
jgi:type IV pilus assembly protein PilQ